MKHNHQEVKIFVSHRIDLDSVAVENDVYSPVRCGACFDSSPNKGIPGDNTGDNISEMRTKVGEFTVQYWAWKNVDADYYGLCHYRRYLSFSSQKYPTDEKNQVIEKNLDDRSIHKYNLDNPARIKDIVSKYDAVVNEYADISNMYTPRGPRPTIKEHFYAYDGYLVNKDDVDLFLDVVETQYPTLGKYAREYFSGSKFRGYNCFILKKDLFFELCEIETKVLRAIRQTGKVNFDYRTKLQERTYGFFVEWLYGVYLYYLEQASNKKIKTVQLVFFENVEVPQYPVPQKEKIPVAVLSNRYLLPATQVLIQSLFKSKNSSTEYDVIILHEELTALEQSKILDGAKCWEGIDIQFLNFKKIIHPASNGLLWDASSNVPFVSMFLPWLLPQYNQVIYLHADTLIMSDLHEIYGANFTDNLVYAARDHLRIAENNSNRDALLLRKYRLGMENPYDFISTSVMLLNLSRIRLVISYDLVTRYALDNYSCRDAANKLYSGHIGFLDARWNVCPYANDNVKLLSEFIPKAFVVQDEAIWKEPKAIHYQFYPKPWQNPFHPCAAIFWTIARQTSDYEQLLLQASIAVNAQHGPASVLTSPLHLPYPVRIANRIFPIGSVRRNVIKKLIPRGSRRWNFLKKIYYTLGGSK